jgi:hypothetical protein
MILRMTITGDFAGKQRAGQLMGLKAQRREQQLAHVPRQQRSRGLSPSQPKVAGGYDTTIAASEPTSGPQAPR